MNEKTIKKSALLMLLFISTIFGCKQIKTAPANALKPTKSIFELSANSIEGEKISLETFKGKKILIVNVASKCGYTPQYKDLEQLYEQYKGKLVILGFPSNDFLKQEPGSSKEIASFCLQNYRVTFPLFEKIAVKGKNISPIYKWLSDKKLNGWNNTQPGWNFCKYLIDENGELLAFYSSAVNPLSDEIISKIR